MSLAEEFRRRASSVWDRILGHPFIREMASGTLPAERFRYYTVQDYLFLRDFMRSLAYLSARAPSSEISRSFARMLHETATVEVESLLRRAESLGLTLKDLEEGEYSPANFAYTRHLLLSTSQSSFLEGVASMVPCFWSYKVIAERVPVSPSAPEAYKSWFETYRSEEYASVVNEILDVLERSRGLGSIEAAYKTFLASSRYEYMFWEDSYREARWPV